MAIDRPFDRDEPQGHRIEDQGAGADIEIVQPLGRELLAARGFRGPVWVTEHGYPADPAFQWDPAYRGGDAAQAAFLRDSIPRLTAAGADQVFVTLRDNLWGEFLSEGLVHVDESNPSYPAARRPAFETVFDQSGELDLEMLVELLQGWWL